MSFVKHIFISGMWQCENNTCVKAYKPSVMVYARRDGICLQSQLLEKQRQKVLEYKTTSGKVSETLSQKTK
jgi:hypothetical protein